MSAFDKLEAEILEITRNDITWRGKLKEAGYDPQQFEEPVKILFTYIQHCWDAALQEELAKWKKKSTVWFWVVLILSNFTALWFGMYIGGKLAGA